MVKENQLNKTCMNCGLQKQISAFLQISGPEGTSYGNICSTCRGSGLGKVVTIPENESDERHSSSSAGLKIDAKSKIHLDIEKKQLKQNQKETEIKETKKLESAKENLLDRKEKKEDAEQKHRQSYIEQKKTEGFLNYQSKKPTQQLPPVAASEKEAVLKKAVLDQHGILATLHKEDAAKHEDKIKNTDLSNIDLDFSQPVEKLRSAEFNKAATAQGWLRTGNAATRFLTNNQATHKTEQTLSADNQKDPLEEYLNEAFQPESPGSSRRR
jgi:hypothetical protein